MEEYSLAKLAELARAHISNLSADVEYRRLVAQLRVTDEIGRFIDRTDLETVERELEHWRALQGRILRCQGR
ncbi:hypothetical protein J8I87_41285 [Paraburkholderia sp. LEh10]|uniref:hypothetical protein n=1 Tax=Paraburkholderia sp. LEh10 TaxID=2821353 RepID=UPI001AE85D17|nr:hypothetical protein [Paraburkholderia sp. LEh10]MBP0595945.1 hypothetical protein [Paraburkholderia sp. LEh10]